MNLLNKLIEFNEFNDNLSSIQEEISVGNVLNINLLNNSVIDGIKVCRSDLKIIEFNQKSQQFKCFWPKCQFKTNTNKNVLKIHKLIDKNERKYKCNECNKNFIQSSSLKTHRLID